MKQKPKIIVALDVDSFAKAKYFIDKLYPEVRIFKAGLQIWTSCGPKIVEYVNRKGAEVFLDLKFFDIPNTIANAVRQAVRLKVKMLTLHILGGREMIVAAVKSAKEESRKLKFKRPLLIGVTVLTSQQAQPQEVLRLARLGVDCGLDGVVCSVREAGVLRKAINKKFIIVTPGIRQDTKTVDDQKRTATASEAAEAGSNFLVIGRPVLEAVDPKGVIRNLFRNNM